MADEVHGPEQDLGPFASERAVVERLCAGVSPSNLLALPADDGSHLYPLFQFKDQDGCWTTASDHLRAGGDVSPVLALVTADRARWKSR